MLEKAIEKFQVKGIFHGMRIGHALRDIHFRNGIVMEPFALEGGQVGRDIKVWRDLSDNAGSE